MKRRRRTYARIVISGFLLATFAISTQPIGVAAQQSNSLSVSPLRQEAMIDPGFVHSGSLMIKNSGDQPQTIELSAETFNVTNQAYDYLFIPKTTEAKWVTFSEQTPTLTPGESRTVGYEVSVPLETEPRGYYLAFFALNRASGQSGGITPTERIASLLYLTVNGEATKSGKLIELRSPFVLFAATDWSATLQNSGTLHYRSTYSWKVSFPWNQEVSSQEDSRLVLPRSVRLIEAPLNPPNILGFYKVTYSVSLGDSPAHNETKWFLYLPPLQIVLIALIIGGLSILFRHKKHP